MGEGVKFFDEDVGDGAEAKDGLRCTVRWSTVVFSKEKRKNNRRIEEREQVKVVAGQKLVVPGFDLALLGAGNMPPMRAGGKRYVILEPELAYGQDGKKCGISDNC